jgi:hypothetical protein
MKPKPATAVNTIPEVGAAAVGSVQPEGRCVGWRGGQHTKQPMTEVFCPRGNLHTARHPASSCDPGFIQQMPVCQF